MELPFFIGEALAALATGIGAGALAARIQAGWSEKRPLLAVELRFGSELGREAVEALLTAVSGLPRRASVILETLASEDGIRHFLLAEQAPLDNVRGQLAGLIPDLRVEPISLSERPAWRAGARLCFGGSRVLLRTDGAAEAATGMLAALGPLAAGEALLLRITLGPGRPAPLPRSHGRGSQSAPAAAHLLGLERPIEPDEARALRQKNAGPLLRAQLVLAVACGHPKRAAHLLGRLVAVARARRGGLGGLRVRRLGHGALERALAGKATNGDLVSPAEFAGLIAWPIGSPRLAGLRLGSSPLLMPDRNLPERGRVLGFSTWPGMERRALAQPPLGAQSHTLLVGPTGCGKSALLTCLAVSDFEAGRGCLVLDGKGDLAADLLARVPEGRVADVIVLDPGAPGPVPGLRVFGPSDDPELTADVVLAVLRDIYRDSWGVRSEQWLRAGLVTLAHDPKATLGDLPYVFSDDAYRRRLVGSLGDPMLLATWAAFEAMNPRERANQLGAPLNKLSQLLGRRVLRSVLSQPEPTLDLAEAMRRGKIVIVSLAPGRIGAPAARLLGALVLHELYGAIQARAALAPERRRPFFAYVDEPKVLGDVPVPLDSVFELARGMGVGLTVAAQSVSQLPPAVARAALQNAATLVAFRQNHDEDAELLARHLPGLKSEGLLRLGAFEIIARIGLGPGEVTAPASGRTLPPPKETGDPEVMRRTSADRYGRDPGDVDAALAARHGQASSASKPSAGQQAPIGRRRRTR